MRSPLRGTILLSAILAAACAPKADAPAEAPVAEVAPPQHSANNSKNDAPPTAPSGTAAAASAARGSPSDPADFASALRSGKASAAPDVWVFIAAEATEVDHPVDLFHCGADAAKLYLDHPKIETSDALNCVRNVCQYNGPTHTRIVILFRENEPTATGIAVFDPGVKPEARAAAARDIARRVEEAGGCAKAAPGFTKKASK